MEKINDPRQVNEMPISNIIFVFARGCYLRMHCYFFISQCSMVVHNTVVRAAIKVNGKPHILGTRSLNQSTKNLTWMITSAV